MRLPAIDLLKATHTFPGPYVFKIIGPNAPDFVARAVAAVRTATNADKDPAFEERQAEGGRHVAVTFEINVTSPEQVHAIYHALLAVKERILVL